MTMFRRIPSLCRLQCAITTPNVKGILCISLIYWLSSMLYCYVYSNAEMDAFTLNHISWDRKHFLYEGDQKYINYISMYWTFPKTIFVINFDQLLNYLNILQLFVVQNYITKTVSQYPFLFSTSQFWNFWSVWSHFLTILYIVGKVCDEFAINECYLNLENYLVDNFQKLLRNKFVNIGWKVCKRKLRH